jgi:hypothetical protein
MLGLAAALGFAGCVQVELWFLHSPSMKDKERVLAELEQREPAYRLYRDRLMGLLQAAPCVLAWAAANDPCSIAGAGAALKANLLGLKASDAHLLVLGERNGRPSQSLVYSTSGGRLRGLFLTKGNPMLPARRARDSKVDRYALVRQIR